MDPVAEIAELKSELANLAAEATTLKEQLASATEKDDKDRIVLLLGMVNADKGKINEKITTFAAQLPPPPPPLDYRTVLTRWYDKIADSPEAAVSVGVGVAAAFGFAYSSLWISCHNYMTVRHQAAPYTEKQLRWREFVFHIKSPVSPAVTRTWWASAAILVFKAIMNGSLTNK